MYPGYLCGTEVFVLLQCLISEKIQAVSDTLFQIHRLVIQRTGGAFFQFGHIQDIVDQSQKLLAGLLDFLYIVPDFFGSL